MYNISISIAISADASSGHRTVEYEIPLVSMVVPIAPILLNSSRLQNKPV